MLMKKSLPRFQSNDGKIMLALAFIIVVSAFFFAGGYFRLNYSPKDETLYDNPIPKDFTSKNNLQLEYLKFGTQSATRPGIPVTQPPGKPACIPKYTDIPRDQIGKCVCTEIVGCKYKIPKETLCVTPDSSNSKSGGCVLAHECMIGEPYCQQMNPSFTCPPPAQEWNGISAEQCTADFEAGLCEIQCLAKPVIYLYPEHELFVDVKLEIPGRVTVSDPLYPADGWKQVLAYPNTLGAIKYQGKDYPYLYYETEVMEPEIPTQGFVVKTELLESKLRDMLTKLGLINHEQDDFIEYWIPMLEAKNKPYMFVTILPHEEKEKVDKVIMSVEPDTRIEVIFEFEPLDEFKIVSPLKLPATPPKREGFTLVEWGGAIND